LVVDGYVALAPGLSHLGGVLRARALRSLADVGHEATARSSIRCLTARADGLVSVLPSANSMVGTVWNPPFTLITYSAAAGSRSMSTSLISIPSSASCLFSLRQYPHQVVVYIVGRWVMPGSSLGAAFAPGHY